jgi:2-oxoglutarate ferredoxin oxidoreductase subunit gamma
MTRTEVKISGYGGQGVLTLGALITNTSIMYTDTLNASQSESYGAAARGGACWSEVVIEDSPEEINYPRTTPKNVDVGIFLTDEAVSKYLGEIKREGGIVIYDPSSVGKIRTKNTQVVYSIPAQQMARENLKNPLTTNAIMFGAFTAIMDIFDKAAALKGVKEVSPAKAYDINIQAFNVGYDFALEQKKNLKKAA